MEPGFAQSNTAKPPQHIQRSTPLANIETAAECAERSINLIQAFLARFRGDPTTGATLQPVPEGHSGQLLRLGDALDRIEALASQLSDIG